MTIFSWIYFVSHMKTIRWKSSNELTLHSLVIWALDPNEPSFQSRSIFVPRRTTKSDWGPKSFSQGSCRITLVGTWQSKLRPDELLNQKKLNVVPITALKSRLWVDSDTETWMLGEWSSLKCIASNIQVYEKWLTIVRPEYRYWEETQRTFPCWWVTPGMNP